MLGTAPNFSGTFGDLATRGRPILLSRPPSNKGMLQLLVAALTLRSPQVLRMRDATTKQEIALVGTVHYNPASVERSKEEVTPYRWTGTKRLAPSSSSRARADGVARSSSRRRAR